MFVVHLVDDEDNTMDVHVSRMRRFSAKTMGTNVDIDELARHDLQQLEVEEFSDHRVDAAGNLELFTRWRGFSIDEASWEPVDRMIRCVEGLVYNYCQRTLEEGDHGDGSSGSDPELLTELMALIKDNRQSRSQEWEW